MPRAQYRVPLDGVELYCTFPTPKRVGDLDEWVRQCAEGMPGAAAFTASARGSRSRYLTGAGWYLSNSGATERMVSFEFLHSDGRRAYLVIDRAFRAI